ncbi:biotin--[acetyl-CoA-carboxylase] ligase [Polaribacter undariae]|uniref:biotin--[biotin carboxyl-carrier protein] ligase n=1 Tax=Polaribacter sejongensis TaxID=985043 RepID=A0AAJ1VG72_9FLAO|nr:biotin--[acetyl-CoA-carboxylase] ligase [Polaribacter undariae]MDN3619301.1 biotin--[acetyl-CoA-carboxylase] ligase [Polaribacter undariae]UWD33499.1 biotin--[acetyl-CoA-carboxylase] ligase [Polaribacter undariae]
MKTIKLSATDSTNSFLKDLAQNSTLENFTTVVTQNQIKGRGQQQNKWVSEPHKNLTFSIFISFTDLKVVQKKYLNFAISLAIYDVLFANNLPKPSIKWPNDILSANKKICGILIENTFSGDRIKNSFVGIGININQETFPAYLNNATSLKLETGLEYDLDLLLKAILDEIKKNIKRLTSQNFNLLEEKYLDVLYKKNIPTMFKNSKDEIFMGMISGISDFGKLQVQLEDDVIQEFGLKEISFL